MAPAVGWIDLTYSLLEEVQEPSVCEIKGPLMHLSLLTRRSSLMEGLYASGHKGVHVVTKKATGVKAGFSSDGFLRGCFQWSSWREWTQQVCPLESQDSNRHP